MTFHTDLTNSVAIVTVASNGLGRHSLSVLSHNGAQVVAAARRIERLKEFAAVDNMVHGQTCDVTDADDVAQLAEVAIELRRPDIVVHLAGFGEVT